MPESRLTRLRFNWKLEHPPVVARAMIVANDKLFVAGPPDVVDEKAMWGRSNEALFGRKMAEQVGALEGRKGAALWAVSAKGGRKLAERKLDVLPAFDGTIAADGRLFVSTADGSLICFEGK